MIYVDNARIPATVGRVKGRWSHLTADSIDELNEFAVGIGLQPEWFQTCKTRCSREGEPCPHWHYDVIDSKRKEAVAAGARPIDLREMGALITTRRETHRAAQAANHEG